MLQSQMTELDAGKLVLRWTEDPEQPLHEMPVDMLEAHLSEAVISALERVHERTEVQLIGHGYQEAGVVRSCRSEGTRFILIIGITSAPALEPQGFQRDPGSLSVENFLTEEEADQILDELDRELGSDCDPSSSRWSALSQFRATLRLLRFGNVLDRLCAGSRVNHQFCG